MMPFNMSKFMEDIRPRTSKEIAKKAGISEREMQEIEGLMSSVGSALKKEEKPKPKVLKKKISVLPMAQEKKPEEPKPKAPKPEEPKPSEPTKAPKNPITCTLCGKTLNTSALFTHLHKTHKLPVTDELQRLYNRMRYEQGYTAYGEI